MLPFSGFLSSRGSCVFVGGLFEGTAGRCEGSCLGFPCTGFTETSGAAGVKGRGGVSGRLGGVLPDPFGAAGAGAATGGFDWVGLLPAAGWLTPEGLETSRRLLTPVGARLGPCCTVPPETAPGFLTGMPEGAAAGFCGGVEETSAPTGLDAGRFSRLLLGGAGRPGVPGVPGAPETPVEGVWMRGPFYGWEAVWLVWPLLEAVARPGAPAGGVAAGAGREGLPGLWGVPAFFPSFAVTVPWGTGVFALRVGAFSWLLFPLFCGTVSAGACEVGWPGVPG